MKKVFLNIFVVSIIFSLLVSSFGLTVDMCKCDGQDFDTYSVNLKYTLKENLKEDCCADKCVEEKCRDSESEGNSSNCTQEKQDYLFDVKLNLKSNLEISYSASANLEASPLLFTLIEPKTEVIRYNETSKSFLSPLKRLILYIIEKSGKTKANS